ncbi:MAG: HD-GYP domain-containing protein, partial [Solirubrobacteraceae bacterium]
MDHGAPASVVNDYIAPAQGRHLPQMLLATTVVAVLPLVVSLALRASGLVSGWVSVGLAVVMSLASSTAGSAYWRKRGGDSDVLFGELLLWGWIRSWRQERELANATRLLDLVNTGAAQHDELTLEQREQLLQQLAGALEGQDVYLNGHSRRVARHATMIARGMGLSSEEVARIRAAAAVHDVGKLRTPKAILNKPGRLTDEEFDVIKRHPVDGAGMVAALGDPELTRIVRHHHERLDGAGYPDRLRGEEIPVGARIIAVADTFDAITSARPYRDAAPHQKAIDILRTEAGTQLDPEAVRSFLAYYSGSRPTVVWAIIT